MTSLQALVLDRPELLTTGTLSELSLEHPGAASDSVYVTDETLLDSSEIILALLQPLADPGTLAKCRGHSPCSNCEILNIQHLSSNWRRALASTRPIHNLTFDLSLPDVRVTQAGKTLRLCWNDSLAIVDREVASMIHSIATVMRMRVQG